MAKGMSSGMAIDIERLAEVLYGWDMNDGESEILYFNQMSDSVKESYRFRARWIANKMGWKEL